MSIILHIANRDEWNKSSSSEYYKSPSLNTDGFIHCSTFSQTVETANQFYANQKNLVLLCIDTEKVEAKVKFEGPACDGDESINLLFPHIYGPLNISAVTAIFDFSPNEDGTFNLPNGLNKLALK